MAFYISGSVDADPRVSVAVGIVVGLLASIIQSLGLTIQRKSHIQNQARPEEERKVDYKRSLWLFGFVIFISSNILGSIFQIASLPVVLLAPLGAVSLLWNALFARMILGDLFSKFTAGGTFLIVVGAVLIGVYGIVPEPTHSLNDLLMLFRRSTFAVYFTLLGVTVLAILVIAHFTEWRYNRAQLTVASHPDIPQLQPVERPTTPGEGDETEVTPLLDPKIGSAPPESPQSRTPTLLAMSYSSMSGILSGMCLIFAKSGVELLLLTAAGYNQFNRWESWILVLGLIVFALLQLWYLHKSLILEDPTLVCPLAFCCYNVSSIVNGLVYFDQFGRLSNKGVVLVVLGVFLLLGGVWAVSHQESEDDGGIVEGDWSVAAAIIESSPPSPIFPTFTRLDSSSYGFPSVNQRTPSYESLPYPHRRVVSSPSPEPALRSRNQLSDPLGATDAASILTRPRALSSSHPSISLQGPISPPRRRSVRRSTLVLLGESGSPPAGGPPIGGFSIGLSPLSPGFTLMPRQRDDTYPLASNFNDDDAEMAGEHSPRRPASRLAKLWNTLRWKTH